MEAHPGVTALGHCVDMTVTSFFSDLAAHRGGKVFGMHKGGGVAKHHHVADQDTDGEQAHWIRSPMKKQEKPKS